MSECTNIQFISQNEYIGNSLTKINTNFQLLSGAACQLKQILDNRVNIRTFFYYGPNSQNNATEFDNQASRPSNATIQRFVNNEVGLPTISENGDFAWVIYQRTGWRNLSQEYSRGGSGSIPFERTEAYGVQVAVPVIETISIGRRGQINAYNYYTEIRYRPMTYWAPYSWQVSIADQYRAYAPILVIYKLKYSDISKLYSVESGFPKYTRATTASTIYWNNPEFWNTY